MIRQKLFRWRYAVVALTIITMATGLVVLSTNKALADNPTFSCPDGTIIQPATGATCQNPGPPGSNNNPVVAGAPTSENDCAAKSDGTIFKNGQCVAPANQADCDAAVSGSEFVAGANGAPNACNLKDPCNFPQWELRWAACPLVEAGDAMTSFLNKFIFDYLNVDTNNIFGNNATSNGMYQAWTVFSNLGVGFIVIAALVMIVSEALGFEFVSAYGFRKVMPSLLIAGICIKLTWPVMNFLATLFNDLGASVGHIITAPFAGVAASNPNAANFLSGTLQYGAIVTALLVLGPLGILSFLGTIGLGLLVGAGVLLFRQMVLTLAILVAPFAIALYPLPNTRKGATFTGHTFITALAMFPIIEGFLSLGQVMSTVMVSSNKPGASIAAIIFYFLPYFLLPFAFRLAGGLVATVGGVMNDKSRGGFDRLKKFRGNQVGDRYTKAKEGRGGYVGSNILGGAYRRASLEGGLNPLTRRGRAKYAESSKKFQRAVADKTLEADAGFASGNDDATALATQRGMTRGRFLQEYAARQVASGTDQVTAQRQAHEALGNIEAGFGAQMGTNAMRIASFKARAASNKGYDTGSAAGNYRVIAEDTSGLLNDGLISTSDAAGALKKNAQRQDYAGISFGELMGQLDRSAQRARGGATGAALVTDAEVENMTRGVLSGTAPGQIIQGRHETVTALAPQMVTNVREALVQAHQTGDTHLLDRELASLAGMYDEMSRTSPMKAKIMADNVLTSGMLDPASGQMMTVRQLMEQARQRPPGPHGEQGFLDMRREYGNAYAAQAATAAAQAAQQNGGQQAA